MAPRCSVASENRPLGGEADERSLTDAFLFRLAEAKLSSVK
jgi:hypothetical protein